MIQPRSYLFLWRMGPQPVREFVDEMAAQPCLTRGAAALEIAAGLWLGLKQTEP